MYVYDKVAIQKHISYISIMTTITLGVWWDMLTTQLAILLFPYFAISTIGLMTLLINFNLK
jgi:hypothetical protein